MRKSTGIAVLLCLAIIFFGRAVVRAQNETVRIGVLAKRGADQCLAMWSPTAKYLSDTIRDKAFVIVPLGFDDIYSSVEQGKVDFVLANSSFYVELERWYGINRIATLKNRRLGGVYTKFGGVIFCRADRTDIRKIEDLKGKRFMAVEQKSFGGWRMAWRELRLAGMDPYHDFKSLRFGGTHDAVVFAVRDGVADAGTVRTDTLERMHEEGKIDIQDFYIFDPPAVTASEIPFRCSTRLYPEWPIATVKHTSLDLAERVTRALLAMPNDDAAARAAKCAGWTIPLNYEPVHECLRELKVGPYQDLGKITLLDVLRNYWEWLLAALAVFVITMISAVKISNLNRELKESRDFLARIMDGMHEGLMVIDRNFTIKQVNERFLASYNLPLEQALGEKCHIITHKNDQRCSETNHRCPVREVFATKT
ncbi:MAG: PhnD/SsuA/transferrin family substrate-binding protein, partial [Deltaproteobacteria bacterium]|nr:PhnD/SsuA/transferrin family substrate-binding protein [Deltaproteobacteria bacterium]